MINLTACKTAQEALDKVAQQSGYLDIPATLIFHKSEITGIDLKFGEAILKWRKPRE
jgi:hypothetical protein